MYGNIILKGDDKISAKVLVTGLANTGKTTLLKALENALVVNDYILASKANKVEAEKQIIGKVCNGIYVGGTCDRIEYQEAYFCSDEAYKQLT